MRESANGLSKRSSKKLGKKGIIWLVVATLVLGGVGYWIFGGSVQADSATITWVKVEKGTVAKAINLSGTLDPANQATLTSNGTVTSLSVKTGQHVKKGQVIAQLDVSSLKVQLVMAQAQLDQAVAKWKKAKEPTTTMNNQGQTMTQQPDANEVELAWASVVQAKAQVTSTKQQIADGTLKSPIDGTVLQVSDGTSTSSNNNKSNGSSYGNNTGSGNTIAVIANLNSDQFVVDATVSQSDATHIKAGQTATIQLSTDDATRLTGVVKELTLIPQTNSGVTSYPVTIQVDRPTTDTTFLPGTNVTVKVLEKRVDNVLRIPTAALTQRHGMVGVYTRATGQASGNGQGSNGSTNPNATPAGLQFTPVQVGTYGGEFVEITSGLTEGEEIAIYLPTSTTSNSAGSSNRGLFGGFGGGGGGFRGGDQGGQGNGRNGNGSGNGSGNSGGGGR